MIQPPLPENEEARLAELLSYGVLDTESEALLDDITSLASEICGTPIALISLVDHGHGMSGEQLLAYASARSEGSLPLLIESLHGKLKIKSASGAGTLVIFSVPVRRTETGETEQTAAKPKRMPVLIPSPRILFVEKDDTVQQEMGSALAAFRLQTELASDEQQAVSLMSEQEYDLVILSATTCSQAMMEQVRRAHPSSSLIAVGEELFAREHDNLPVDDSIALPLNNDTLSALLSFYLIADGKFTQ